MRTRHKSKIPTKLGSNVRKTTTSRPRMHAHVLALIVNIICYALYEQKVTFVTRSLDVVVFTSQLINNYTPYMKNIVNQVSRVRVLRKIVIVSHRILLLLCSV